MSTSNVAARYVSIAEACARYSVSDSTLRRAIWDRRIPSYRVGRQYRLDVEVLDQLFARAVVDEPDGSMSVTRPPRRQRAASG
jgi:excisionase family DNA binding protein